MKIVLDNIGKRFTKDWIFRNVSTTFETGKNTVILGPNGSGKSTLLQLISGFMMPTEGSIEYQNNDEQISDDKIQQYVAVASPYLELIDRLTLKETLEFHASLKGFMAQVDSKRAIELLGMEKHQDKLLGSFSSGMKMRVRLALAILSDVPVLLLDEPLSNLDDQGVGWYKDMIDQFAKDKLIIVCSNNVKDEFFFCQNELQLSLNSKM